MKLLASITIWLLAILLAGLLILRLVRGRPTLVRSAVGRRAIRIAALVLVFTGTNGLVGGGASGQNEPLRRDSVPPNHADQLRQLGLIPSHFDRFMIQLPDRYAEAQIGISFGQALGRALVGNDLQRTDIFIGFTPSQLAEVHELAPNLYRVMRAQLPKIDWPLPEGEVMLPIIDWQVLHDAAEEAYQSPYLNTAVQMLLWRQTQQLDFDATNQMSTKYLRDIVTDLHQQAKFNDALTRALSDVGLAPMRINQRAWASKAQPQPERYRQNITDKHAEIQQAIRDAYPEADAALWIREGLLEIEFNDESQPPAIIRGDLYTTMVRGQPARVSRLDLLVSQEDGGVISSPWLGEIKLPANATLRICDLPALLTDESRAKIAATIQAVLNRPEVQFDDDIDDPKEAAAQEAAVQLERHLPLVAPMLAQAIREHPEAYGTATLRTLLNQYQLPAEAVDTVRELRQEGLGD